MQGLALGADEPLADDRPVQEGQGGSPVASSLLDLLAPLAREPGQKVVPGACGPELVNTAAHEAEEGADGVARRACAEIAQDGLLGG